MTKSDLLKLPRKKLAEIAEEFSLSLDDYDSKEEFIEDLFEAAAEETRESLKANNTVSQIRRSKFVFNSELSLWVFVLWQISNVDSMNFRLNDHDYRLLIRVCECESVDGKLNQVDEFDIQVTSADSSRYINLPHQDRYYYMELFCVRPSSRVMLARTNTVFSPQLRIDNLGDFVNIDSLLISNKIYESVLCPPAETDSSSQKIIRDHQNEGDFPS